MRTSLLRRTGHPRIAATALASLTALALGAGMLAAPATTASAAIPPMPQGYPIANLYAPCTNASAQAAGYPDWHYGETGRRYLSDGTIQFTNSTDQAVPYTATVETGTNHKISANSAAELPSNWNTTAKSDIGALASNGWIDGETFGPITLKPGESFRVEYGVLEKDFISMFMTCDNGRLRNAESARVIRGTVPAERYAFAYVIRADGSVADQALEIPSRAQGANSKPIDGTYTSVSGPSLEQVADPARDRVAPPNEPLRRDPSWPKQGQTCRQGDNRWYPLDVDSVTPTFRKPGYSQDFLNWSKTDYQFNPVTDFVVGAEFNGYLNWFDRDGRLPEGWLNSVGTVQRAYMPVGTPLKSVSLAPGERVRVEYGTTMTRVNYRELHCGKDKTYSLVSNYPQATAPSGFWAEAVVTSPNGSTRRVDVTPDDYANLPVPTQSNI